MGWYVAYVYTLARSGLADSGSPGLQLRGVAPARHGERRDAPKATAIATHPRGGEWLELDRWNPVILKSHGQ
jgi:hypothetical protein